MLSLIGTTNRMSSKKNQVTDSAITVCVRIRPRTDKEDFEDEPICFIPTAEGNGVEERDAEHNGLIKVWPYDNIFGSTTSNAHIFGSVGKELVDSALSGFNAVLFMYGQTSSGISNITHFKFLFINF